MNYTHTHKQSSLSNESTYLKNDLLNGIFNDTHLKQSLNTHIVLLNRSLDLLEL